MSAVIAEVRRTVRALDEQAQLAALDRMKAARVAFEGALDRKDGYAAAQAICAFDAAWDSLKVRCR